MSAALSRSVKENNTFGLTATPKIPESSDDNHKMQQEKIRALFSKYDMKLQPGEWTSTGKEGSERIERKIRMRIHRLCHRCDASFGTDQTCNNCQHTRCKKCPRLPPKKSADQRTLQAAKALPYDLAILVDDSPQLKGPTDPSYLKFRSRITGIELSRREPIHRVRRMCHKCDTLFVGNTVECLNCKHLRCAQCPRDP